MLSVLLLAAITGLVGAQSEDPCTTATTAQWVSSKEAHACELNVPFNKTRSLSVVDSCIKSLQYYSLENWFLHSPNPLIPHDVNIRSLLTAVQQQTQSSGYKTDWDFNVAITDAYDREQDGHTIFEANCSIAFSYNLPFSIATLAANPADTVAYPTFLVNYDFPNQARQGLEDYFTGLGVDIRPYDSARILSINGVDASSYMVNLAQNSSVYEGILGAFEDVNPRYMRLMSRYSADTISGGYTQEVGKFSQRVFYPGADSIAVTLELQNGTQTSLTIPWAATFVGSASKNDTASFIAETCLASPDATNATTRRDIQATPRLMERLRAVTQSETQPKMRVASVNASATNKVAPNLTSFGHFVTLDIYQLQEHPKVGAVYFEQFEPSDGTDANTYFAGITNTLFNGLVALKAAGVEKVLLDVSGNRGGYVQAGAINLWSLWPEDLFPGFPSVFRDGNLTRQESDIASSTNNQDSEYNFHLYRDLNYTLLTSNAQFLDPPVPQVVNGVQDAFSHQFFDDFGNSSAALTNFTSPPFQAEDYVIVSNGICASTCSVFSSYLFQKHQVQSAVFGGTPNATVAQFDGGVKGSEVTDYDTILSELQFAGLQDDPNAPQPFPIQVTLTYNYRNAIPYIDQQDQILDFVYEAGTKKYQYTPETFNRPQLIWEFVADQFFPSL